MRQSLLTCRIAGKATLSVPLKQLTALLHGAAVNSEGNYRQRIYEKYASRFQPAGEGLNADAAARWGKAYKHYLRGWLPGDPNAAILDVACGSGRFLHLLKTLGYLRIAGVDISPEQVRLSRQIADQVMEADAIGYLEANREAFDVIAGMDIIEHFGKNEALRFLDACHGALKPGGRLILQTPNADSPWIGTVRYGDFTHETGFGPELLNRLLRMTGFVAVEARELGPVPLGYSMASTARAVLWRMIRAALKLWNLVETGSSGSGVFTRVFLVSARK